MDVRYFVRIEVPTFRNETDDGGGTHGVTGTGYPVGRDLILTALHVVKRKNRDDRYPIRIRWVCFPEFGEGGRVELDSNDAVAIAYPAKNEAEQNDDGIALLRCPSRPPEMKVPPWAWSSILLAGKAYRSIGYPSATEFKDPDTGAPMPTQNVFQGEIRVSAESWFEITEPSDPKTAEGWKGASGMPIFVGDKIVGVLSACPIQVNAKGHAIPIAPLLNDPAFKALFEDESLFDEHWNGQREKTRDEVARILRGSPMLLEQMRDEFDRLSAFDSPSVESKDQYPALIASRLLGIDECERSDGDVGTSADDVFAEFNRVIASTHDALSRAQRDPGKSKDAESALDDLLAVTLYSAPVLYDPHQARSVYVSATRAELVELPAALYAVAELMIATAEGRKAAFQRLSDPNDQDVRGLACLSIHVPELGIDATHEEYCELIDVHLGRKAMSSKAFNRDDFLKGCHQFLTQFYPKGRPVRGQTKEERYADECRGINQKLGRWSDLNRETHKLYTVFRPDGPQEYKEMYETAKILESRYSNLRIIFLTAYSDSGQRGNHPWDDEAERLDALIKLLPLRTVSKGDV
ncbi:hypothetical protein L0E83_01100 [Marichromatium gracile]|uniref:hypothetical protein n=1 Tax=Marichromatium gracile TaxID=1048 RepID=UPI001F217D03|nr:hypothetical protein [Marichromatium gracile]MCF1182032.1 hypothetical protein [Marichromatium gracile]